MEELNEFRRRLEDHFQDLTKSEQRIASFFLSSHDQAAFLTASQIAKELDVSEATIVRFAKSVGYESFPELRRALQEIYRVQVTPATRLQRKLADLKSGQKHILSQLIDMELQYLTEAENSIDTADFDRAVRIILNGERIFVFGTGPSRILADLVELRLRRFGLTVFSLRESGRDLLDKLLPLRRNDIVLAAGFHHVTPELRAVLEHATKIGAKSVLLTDTLGTTFKGKADVILSARRGPVSTFHSLTVPMAILNAMILAIAMAKSDESVTFLNKLQELRAEYGQEIGGKLNS